MKPQPAGKSHLALLRGINVGGKNLIPMAALRSSFERLGHTGVRTYIQSGNVLFHTPATPIARLEHILENALSEQFNYPARVVVISHATLRQVVGQAPTAFGKKPDAYRYDVLFLKRPLTPGAALKATPTKPGVDAASAGKHALYFSRLIRRATQSHLGKLVQQPAYQSMTIRNWNTTTRLLELMDAAP